MITKIEPKVTKIKIVFNSFRNSITSCFFDNLNNKNVINNFLVNLNFENGDFPSLRCR